MINEQLKATDALLDIGVSVPLRTIRFRRWKRTPRVTIKRPPLGGLLRILRVWLSMEVSSKDISEMDESARLQFVEKNGKKLAKMVSLMLCRGWLSGRLLAPFIRYFLLWRTHPDTLLLATVTFVELQNTKSFKTIIELVENINLLETKASQKRRRS